MQSKEQTPHPPAWADKFLEWYCHPDLLEDLQGDLYEIFEHQVQQGNVKKANRQFIWLVLRSFRLSAIKKPKKIQNSSVMITQNFKVAFRVLKRDKFNTTLNILGLCIGIICFLLMGLYVKQEISFDQFHSKKDRIYRSWLYEDYGDGKTFFNSVTPFRFEELFEEEFPEIETAVQFLVRNYPVGTTDNTISEPVGIISPEFFEVFDFQLIDGNTQNPLPDRNSLIISQAYATKYFGGENPLGKTLGIQFGENIRNFTITAVVKNIRKASSIQFDLAISNENNRELFGDRAMTGWFTVAPETYVLIKDNSTVESVEAKTQDVVMSYLAEEMNRDEYNIGFQPLMDIHLNPEIPVGNAPVSNPKYVYILGLIGTLVLIIACINYTTLSIGQSLKRAREVGMRKVLGARRRTLIGQYLSESLLISLFAMGVGTVLAILLIPTFNRLTGTELVYVFEWLHLFVFLAVGMIIGILAGLYPVFVLSSTRVMAIMQETNASKGKHALRKGMVVFQFLITVFLISSTLIMRKQLNYLQEKDLGYEPKNTISVPLHADPSADRFQFQIMSAFENGELLKSKLEQYPEITDIGMGSHVFGTSGWANLAFTDDQGVFRRFRFLNVDANYLKSFDIEITEGRDFEEESGLDSRQSVILNEAAVEYFGLENSIGKKLPNKEFGDHRIIGVTEDFHFASLHEEVEPLVIAMNPVIIYRGISDGDMVDSVIPKLVFNYTGSQITKGVELLEETWESTFPNRGLSFNFVNQQLKLQYESEARMNKLITVATIISIIIAGIGLLGLTVLVVNSREKEIGIRKVMGASPSQIFSMLARIFSIQLVIAIILSVPLTIWLMRDWLDNFAYRISIGADMFLLSTVVSFILAILVISYHAMKAARINPVHSLRNE